MLRIVLTLLLIGCGPHVQSVEPEPARPPAPQHVQPAEALPPRTVIQQQCRADRNVELFRAAGVLVSLDCPQDDVFGLASLYLDMGARDGEAIAEQSVIASTLLCVCENGGCDDAAKLKVAKFAGETADKIEQQEGAGAAQISDALAGNQCTRAATAIEIYKMGLWCAVDHVTTGGRAVEIRKRTLEPSRPDLQAACSK